MYSIAPAFWFRDAPRRTPGRWLALALVLTVAAVLGDASAGLAAGPGPLTLRTEVPLGSVPMTSSSMAPSLTSHGEGPHHPGHLRPRSPRRAQLRRSTYRSRGLPRRARTSTWRLDGPGYRSSTSQSQRPGDRRVCVKGRHRLRRRRPPNRLMPRTRSRTTGSSTWWDIASPAASRPHANPRHPALARRLCLLPGGDAEPRRERLRPSRQRVGRQQHRRRASTGPTGGSTCGTPRIRSTHVPRHPSRPRSVSGGGRPDRHAMSRTSSRPTPGCRAVHTVPMSLLKNGAVTYPADRQTCPGRRAPTAVHER